MDDINLTLSLLHLPPDRNLELSNQIMGPPLGNFICFPKLPLELRDLVWKFTLPAPRAVNLNPSTIFTGEPFKTGPLPIALHVNQERRRVVLRQYHLAEIEMVVKNIKKTKMINPSRSSEPTNTLGQVIAVGPSRDSIYMSFLHGGRDGWTSYLRELGTRYEALFSSIRSLELRGVVWETDIDRFYPPSVWTGTTSPLLHFEGLEELHLIPFKGQEPDYDENENAEYVWPGGDDWETCVKKFHKRFARFAKKNPARKIPEIFLHEWRRLQARTPEENREDSLVPYLFTSEDEVDVEEEERSTWGRWPGEPDPFGEWED